MVVVVVAAITIEIRIIGQLRRDMDIPRRRIVVVMN